MTDEQIDHLITARNILTDQPIDYALIRWSAVDHIDAVLRDVPPGQRADVDALLGRKRIIMVQHTDGAVEVAPEFTAEQDTQYSAMSAGLPDGIVEHDDCSAGMWK